MSRESRTEEQRGGEREREGREEGVKNVREEGQ